MAVDLAAQNAGSIAELSSVVGSQAPDDFQAPIVMAHSGTGSLIPDIGRSLGASQGVRLAALIPSKGQSLLEEIALSPTAIFDPEWMGIDPTSDPMLASYFLFHDCDLETLRWAATTLRLFAPSFLYSNPLPTDFNFPSTDVLGGQDRVIRPEWGRREALARLGSDIVELNCGHFPHVSRAAETAKILDEISRTSSRPRRDHGRGRIPAISV